MIIIIQLLFIFFAIAMIYIALIHFKKRELTNTDMFVWFLVWIFAILLVVFPDFLRSFSQTFMFARLFDLVVVFGFVFVVVIVSKAYLRTRQLERKLEKIIRNDALDKLDEKKDAKKK